MKKIKIFDGICMTYTERLWRVHHYIKNIHPIYWISDLVSGLVIFAYVVIGLILWSLPIFAIGISLLIINHYWVKYISLPMIETWINKTI
jgi:hypothetical protein